MYFISHFYQALQYGIDGWKCDGTDPYILELIIPKGDAGVITRKEYSDAYYGDFYDYTHKKNGNNTLIMSRSVDGLALLITCKCYCISMPEGMDLSTLILAPEEWCLLDGQEMQIQHSKVWKLY